MTASSLTLRTVANRAAAWPALALLAAGPVSFLIADEAGGVVWALSMLAGLIVACTTYRRWWPALRASRLLAVCFALLLVYLALPVWSYLVVDASEFAGSRVKRQFLLLAVPFVFLLFWWLRPRLITVLALIAANASVFGLYALWFVGSQAERVAGVTHAVHFGNVSLFLGFASLALVPVTARYRWRVLAGVAVALGIAGSLLAGARGGWLAAPLLFVIALVMVVRLFRLRRYTIPVLAGLVSLILAGLWHTDAVQTRITQAQNSFAELSKNHWLNPIGFRLAMWEQAWREIREAPVLGTGYSGYRDRIHAAVKSGALPKPMLRFATEPHNEYLYQWTTRGIPGLAVFLFCLAGAGWCFAGWLWRGDASRLAVAHVGLSLVVVVAVAGLTITIVDQRAVIRFLGWSLAVLIYCAWSCESDTSYKRQGTS